jgi:hypothetical protein
MPRLALALLAVVALGAAGCAGDSLHTQRISVDPAAKPALVTAPFGDLVEQWVDVPGSLFVRRPRPDLGSYHAMRIARPTIFYDRGVTAPLVTDHSLLMRSLEAVVRGEMHHSLPLPETKRAGEGVLRVEAEVTDLEFDRSRATNSRVTSIVQPGRTATFVLQLSDDAAGTPLVRIAVKRPMPGGIFTGPWSPDIDRAVLLFREFAHDAHDSLGHVVRPPAAPE